MTEKSCAKCNQIKDINNFRRKGDTYHSYCKICFNEYIRSRYIPSTRPKGKQILRPVTVNDKIATVYGTKGFSAIIDARYADEVNKFNWRTNIRPKAIYLQTEISNKQGDYKTVTLHTLIGKLNNWEFEEVDHIDPENTLDCRIDNLRPVTHKENSYNRRKPTNNTSGCKNVYWRPRRKHWEVSIRANGIDNYFGSFEDFETACQVAKDKRAELHGQFVHG